MSNEKMREEFEAWANGRYGWETHDPYRDESERTLSSWNGERYDNRIVEGMWVAWQASREALVIELPGDKAIAKAGDKWSPAFLRLMYRKILTQMGVKVKP